MFASDLLRITFDPRCFDRDSVAAHLKPLGYGAVEFSPGLAATPDRDTLSLRLGIAAALWMNVMLFSLVVYASYFEAIAEWARRGIPFVLAALTAPVVFYCAWPVLRKGWGGIRAGVLSMDALLSAGVLAAFGYSLAQAIRGGQHLYFDTACAIVTLVLAGKALERAAKERARGAITLLYRLMPKKARVCEGARERFVAVEDLVPGMLIQLQPGERVPADAEIIEGRSAFDESVVTGEALPRQRGPGDSIVSGSVNTTGAISAVVTRRVQDGTLAQIVRSVEAATEQRTPMERAADRLSRWFVPLVFLIALATLGVHLATGMVPSEAMLRAISVIVIACPCALGIATPLAISAAVGAASRRGILIRDAAVLEALGNIDCVAMDKTGTLTEGRFELREAVWTDGSQFPLAAALEARSEHPIALAIVEQARREGLTIADASDVTALPGEGIRGTVAGHEVLLGSAKLLDRFQIDRPPLTVVDPSLTAVWICVDRQAKGVMTFGDAVRRDAARLVSRLRAAGLRTVLLSGDAPAGVAALAARLGVDEACGGIGPAEKASAIAVLCQQGRRVAMIGDGINDAPALAAAHLGIAMGSGTDLAMQAAPVVLMSDDLSRAVDTFTMAARTQRVVRQNLFWAFAYNVLGIGLAVAGVLNPILAAVAMVLSSACVIGNSYRLEKNG